SYFSFAVTSLAGVGSVCFCGREHQRVGRSADRLALRGRPSSPVGGEGICPRLSRAVVLWYLFRRQSEPCLGESIVPGPGFASGRDGVSTDRRHPGRGGHPSLPKRKPAVFIHRRIPV